MDKIYAELITLMCASNEAVDNSYAPPSGATPSGTKDAPVSSFMTIATISTEAREFSNLAGEARYTPTQTKLRKLLTGGE